MFITSRARYLCSKVYSVQTPALLNSCFGIARTSAHVAKRSPFSTSFALPPPQTELSTPTARMKAAPDAGWTLLGTPASELRLEFTLPTGQSFRWKEAIPGEFIGVLAGRAVQLKQLEDDVAFRVLARAPGALPAEDSASIADYFNLTVSLTSLSQGWSKADPHFARLAKILPGARMLRQDPVECLFSFICSQNNHISRIHGMVNKLAQRYGTPLDLSSAPSSAPLPPLFAFPTLEQLKTATEEELREAGFGYRAKYIVGAVEELSSKTEGGVAWLMALRSVPFDEAVAALVSLPGVGPKVGACVALFSLDKHEAIPVDTHVWQLAVRRYCTHLRGKTNNPKLHPEIQAALISRFGPYAGWAHNTLFIGELASIKAKLKMAAGSDAEESESEEEEDSEEEFGAAEATSSEDEEEAAAKAGIVMKGAAADAGGEGPVTPEMLAGVTRTKRKAATKAMKRTKRQLVMEDD